MLWSIIIQCLYLVICGFVVVFARAEETIDNSFLGESKGDKTL